MRHFQLLIKVCDILSSVWFFFKGLGIQRERKDISITETPKEKLERTQKEFDELKQELTTDSENNEDTQLPLILREIEQLQSELSNIVASNGKSYIEKFYIL